MVLRVVFVWWWWFVPVNANYEDRVMSAADCRAVADDLNQRPQPTHLFGVTMTAECVAKGE